MEKNIIGQTLYKIRKGKNLTVKYLTQGLISPQHYYRVEKGDAYLSGIFLLEILNRMNVSYKEFSILINSKTEKKKEHFNEAADKVTTPISILGFAPPKHIKKRR